MNAYSLLIHLYKNSDKLSQYFPSYNRLEIIGKIYEDADKEYIADDSMDVKYIFQHKSTKNMASFITDIGYMELVDNAYAFIKINYIKKLFQYILIVKHNNEYYYIHIPVSRRKVDNHNLYYNNKLYKYMVKEMNYYNIYPHILREEI